MTLTALEIKNAKPGLHSDGAGLYLHVGPTGGASWIFRYQLNRRRREMGIGSLAALTAPEARAKAASLKAMVAGGHDPLDARRAAQATEREAVAAAVTQKAPRTFRDAAERHIAMKETGWSNPKHRQQWANTLETYAYPFIGDMPVGDITSAHVLDVLLPIWPVKPETASRVRMRVEAVLNSAKLLGWRSGENPAVWRGGLEAALPPKSRVKAVRHHASLPWQQVAAFMADLRARSGIGARALEFTVLTAARSGEVRHAQWAEIKEDLWIVPAVRMKARREHRVPLSLAALNLLKQMPRIQGCPLVFPGTRLSPLSDMSLSAVLKRMDLGAFTVHGFRSTFRDWAAENTDHDRDAVEMALAHTIGSKTEAAYRRGDMLPKRVKLMAEWAEWCGA